MDKEIADPPRGQAAAELLAIWHRKRQSTGDLPRRADFGFDDFATAIGFLFATELIEGSSPQLFVRLFGSGLDTIFCSNLTDTDLLASAPDDQAAALLTIHRTVWTMQRPHIETDWPAVAPDGRVFRTQWALVPVRRDVADRPYFLGAVDPIDTTVRPTGSRF